jgi:hypothetical protein
LPVGAASSRCDFVGPSKGEALSATAAKRRAEKNGKSFMDILLYTDFIDDWSQGVWSESPHLWRRSK